MIYTCLLNYPATLAFQSQTFSEYLIKGLQIKFCYPILEQITLKAISFITLCKLFLLQQNFV